MAKVFTIIWTEPSIVATGKKTNSTARVLRNGPMVHHTPETILTARSMEQVISYGATSPSMWVNFVTII